MEVAAERERGRADGLNQDDVAWRELALAKAEAATVPALKTALAASRDQTEETDRGASGRPDGKSFSPLGGLPSWRPSKGPPPPDGWSCGSHRRQPATIEAYPHPLPTVEQLATARPSTEKQALLLDGIGKSPRHAALGAKLRSVNREAAIALA